MPLPGKQIDSQQVEVRKASEEDDFSDFDCSKNDEMGLNEFIHEEALDYQKSRLGITYLFLYEEKIVGFATLSMGDIRAEQIENEERLPTDVRTYPSLYIGRLAVDNKYRYRGIGQFIAKWCVGFAVQKSGDIGCRYVTLHTKRKFVGFYRKCNFSVALGEEGHPTVLMYQRVDL